MKRRRFDYHGTSPLVFLDAALHPIDLLRFRRPTMKTVTLDHIINQLTVTACGKPQVVEVLTLDALILKYSLAIEKRRKKLELGGATHDEH